MKNIPFYLRDFSRPGVSLMTPGPGVEQNIIKSV